MADNDFMVESPVNYEQKCLCVLVLDVSGSMYGAPLDQLNLGLQAFQQDIKSDTVTASRLEVSIVTFESEVKTLQDPALIDEFSMPTLNAGGSTRMVDGVREAIAKVKARKSWYKETGQPYYRPWIILITDGEPDHDQDVQGLSTEIRDLVNSKGSEFLAIAVEGADMNTLQKISHPTKPPLHLEGLKFQAFFEWLSQSMGSITNSRDGETVQMADPTGWMKGYSV